MTDMIMNEMKIDMEALGDVNGGTTVKCYLKRRTTGKATLRSGSSQTTGTVAILSANTQVLGSDLVQKDPKTVYTYRFCYVPSIKTSGWIADSLLK